MPSFAVLRNDEPTEGEPDADQAAAALAAIASAAQRIELALGAGGESPFAHLLARLVDATMAVEELRDRKADADAIADAAYQRGYAACAAAPRLRAVP